MKEIQGFPFRFSRGAVVNIAQAVGIALASLLLCATAPAQTPAIANPNLDGIWQAITTAYWDVQPHSATKGRITAMGAEDAEPPGAGIVEGGSIPYLAAAAEQKKKNFDARMKDDPELKCYMPGVPRINYMPYPF